jgi:hypothetical protein
MEKTVDLALNRFPEVPHSLREDPGAGFPKSCIQVNLASLYHHYYLDSYGQVPPDPDPTQFEYFRFFAQGHDFRLAGNGIGISKLRRLHSSAELGQAFCRWFLHDYLDITYFAHIEHVLDKLANHDLGNLRLEKVQSGDVPDYLCASRQHKAHLAEAKGRYSSISFGSREFESWRRQFQRVEAKDSANQSVSLKGFIVGTRFATEKHGSVVRTKVSAEDPDSPGGAGLAGDEPDDLGLRVIALHYGGIAQKLRQPVLAAALLGGYVVPDEIGFPVVVWESRFGPLDGKRFVGGYYLTGDGVVPIAQQADKLQLPVADPFRLDVSHATFFGVEESIFEAVTMLVRKSPRAAAAVRTYDEVQPFYSGISVLRDGSIMSPIEFFNPVRFARY